MATRKFSNRRSSFEVVEPRLLMATDLQATAIADAGPDAGFFAGNSNPSVSQVSTDISANIGSTAVYLRANAQNQASDLNLDGVINHRDVHSLISALNARTSQQAFAVPPFGEGESTPAASGHGSDEAAADVNGDGRVSPADVLWIVNQIKEYDPLTPCDCAACSRPTTEGRCENASIAATQSASLLTEITGMSDVTMAPEGERDAFHLLSQQTSPSVEDLTRSKLGA